MTNTTKGVIAAIIGSIAYGLNPFFVLPQFEEGMTIESITTYRFVLVSICLAVFMLLQKQSFLVNKKQAGLLITLGGLFFISCISLFASFRYMDAGIACTLLFIYPVMVAFVMAALYKERLSLYKYLCIAATILGIFLLYDGGIEPLSVTGFILVMISALSYTIYIIVINKTSISAFSSVKLAFWSMFVCAVILCVRLIFERDLQLIPNGKVLFSSLGLVLISTIVSLVSLNFAIRKIGSTYAAILGAFEPVTAVFVGVLVFDEKLTFTVAIGALIIVMAVSLIIAGNVVLHQLKKIF